MIGLKWDGSLETGDRLVDEQHRTLLEMFNQILDAESHHDADRLLPAALEQLSEYVSLHFSAEESLMRTHGYPPEDFERHVREHQSLSERTRAMIIAFSRGELKHMEPLVEFLCEWLADHIESSDRALVDFVNAEPAR